MRLPGIFWAFFCVVLMAGAIPGQFVHAQRLVSPIRFNTAEAGAAKGWHPARYRGLIVGRSSVRDLLRFLGKPRSIDTPEGQSRTEIAGQKVYFYLDVGEFPGRFTVDVDKRTRKVLGMECAPDFLTKDDAIKHFGSGYVETRYRSCGGDNDEVAPMYEASDGELVYIEYRERGIAILVGFGNQANSIEYVSGAIGFKSLDECKKELKKAQAAGVAFFSVFRGHFIKMIPFESTHAPQQLGATHRNRDRLPQMTTAGLVLAQAGCHPKHVRRIAAGALSGHHAG
jgi:hypothetical protein